jgi:dGTPase
MRVGGAVAKGEAGAFAARWAATMAGTALDEAPGFVVAHGGGRAARLRARRVDRETRERDEDAWLADGATRASGAGTRRRPEAPDALRTCFERDRDRILHSAAFRRLAGKTQVFVFPADHQRTRLTHALEVAQVATSVARACRLNVALTEAIALGHDCGHGPGGHASEVALSPYLRGGFCHARIGADIVLAPLNLCAQTLDGVRNHSWSRPSPSTPEGLVVSWADRIAYCCHDFEDACRAGIVGPEDLPDVVARRCGRERSRQLDAFIGALVDTIERSGRVAMDADHAEALAALRACNYDLVYQRPESRRQSATVVRLLRALVEHFLRHPEELPPDAADVPARDAGELSGEDPEVLAAVAYVGGMTDRFACRLAIERLGWSVADLPRGVDLDLRLR